MGDRTFIYFFENRQPLTRPAVAAHIEHLRALDDRGALVLCGPFKDGEGGMVCVRAADDEAARALADGDPFVAQGFKTYRLRELERAERNNNYLG